MAGTTCGWESPRGELSTALADPVADSRDPPLRQLRAGAGPLDPDIGAELPDWIICGGETGSDARMMDPQWARDLRDQCAACGIAFFMKQMTKRAPIPDDLMIRQYPRAKSYLRACEPAARRG
jgi:hypothetical protein